MLSTAEIQYSANSKEGQVVVVEQRVVQGVPAVRGTSATLTHPADDMSWWNGYTRQRHSPLDRVKVMKEHLWTRVAVVRDRTVREAGCRARPCPVPLKGRLPLLLSPQVMNLSWEPPIIR